MRQIEEMRRKEREEDEKETFGSSFNGISMANQDLFAKLDEYKVNMNLCMADQLGGMIDSNRENIRMKCLEAALKFYLSKEGKLTSNNVINLAEEFYQFVKENPCISQNNLLNLWSGIAGLYTRRQGYLSGLSHSFFYR